MMWCQMKLITLVAIGWLLKGCVATSAMLNLTHTEREIRVGNWFIVVDEGDFSGWVAEFQNNPELKVILQDERSVIAEDQTGNDIGDLWMVSYQPFTHGFCSEMERFRETPEYKEQLKKNGLQIKAVDSTTLTNCKSSHQTVFDLVNGDGSNRGSFAAMVMFDIEFTSEWRYKYVYAGSRCRDGRITSSLGQGTCSWHGGVAGPYYRKEYLNDEPSR